jgi:thymidine phosphorylase
MKTPEAAAELARACVSLAAARGRACRAAVTDMSQPLGSAIGNALDVAEAVRLLRGDERGRLRELTVAFAREALVRLRGEDPAAAAAAAERALDDGTAAERFARMIEAQGGDPRVVEDPWAILPSAPVRHEVRLAAGGTLASVEAEELGRIAASLGAGRMKKGDPIDPAVGIEFFPKIGDRLDEGETVATIHARDEEAASQAADRVLGSLRVGSDAVEAPPLVYGWHGGDA